MGRRITIKDIAKELNTTPATVSRALNNHPEINAQTKLLVKETAAKLQYTPNRMGSALQSGRSKLIGVMIPTAEHPFFGSIVHGISDKASLLKYDVLIYQSNESQEFEEKGMDAFIRAHVDGILISLAKNTKTFTHIRKAVDQKIPVIFFDRTSDELDLSSVTIDDYAGAYNAVRHLFEQGYRKIAHIGGPQHIKAFRRRKEGYVAALRDCSLKLNKQYIIEGDVSLESGDSGFRKLNSLKHPPDAIFAVEDFTALGVVKAAKKAGINMPDELGVFGFCNDVFSAFVTPSISTVDQQTIKMGETSFELLMEHLSAETNSKTSSFPPRHVVLEPVMLFRESSQK